MTSTTPDPDRAARLERLAARRAASGAGKSRTSTDLGAAPVPSVTKSTSASTPRRRAHAAPRARVVAGGLTASAFFAGIASLAAHDRPWLPVQPATADAPPATVLVHHALFVDQYGNPIDAAVVPDGTSTLAPDGASAVVDPATGAAVPGGAAGTNGGSSGGGANTPPAPRTGTSSAPGAGAAPSPSPSPAPSPSPSPAPAPKPPPTTAPAPPPTTAPKPPPTTAPPPPPCTGSKCAN